MTTPNPTADHRQIRYTSIAGLAAAAIITGITSLIAPAPTTAPAPDTIKISGLMNTIEHQQTENQWRADHPNGEPSPAMRAKICQRLDICETDNR